MDSMAARIAKDVDPSTTIKDGQPYGEVCFFPLELKAEVCISTDTDKTASSHRSGSAAPTRTAQPRSLHLTSYQAAPSSAT